MYVSEHFPQKILDARKVLIPICVESNAQNKSAKVVVDKLYIEGKMFTVESLDDLPESLQTIRRGYKQSDEAYVFFTKRSILSNHSETPFFYDGKRYTSGEQFWMREKALFHDDQVSADAIMDTQDPVKQKSIGRKLKNVNMNRWKENVRRLLYPGLLEKFKQNDAARTALLNTGSKKLGEATTERYWGIGLKLSDRNVLKMNRWCDENIVGRMLEDIRTALVRLGL